MPTRCGGGDVFVRSAGGRSGPHPNEVCALIADRQGSPRKVNEYLFEVKPARLYERLAVAEEADAMVFGQTHKPWITSTGVCCSSTCGSVGKPKDGDVRGAFAVLDLGADGRLAPRIERVSYDAETVAREVAAAGLPAEYAQKLLVAA